MNWYIGQEVICINASSTDLLVKDKIYIIEELRKGCCSIELNVGIKDPEIAVNYGTKCLYCGNIKFNGKDNSRWYKESRFVPLDVLNIELTELNELLLIKTK